MLGLREREREGEELSGSGALLRANRASLAVRLRDSAASAAGEKVMGVSCFCRWCLARGGASGGGEAAWCKDYFGCAPLHAYSSVTSSSRVSCVTQHTHTHTQFLK